MGFRENRRVGAVFPGWPKRGVASIVKEQGEGMKRRIGKTTLYGLGHLRGLASWGEKWPAPVAP